MWSGRQVERAAPPTTGHKALTALRAGRLSSVPTVSDGWHIPPWKESQLCDM
jgi:hypothetical protein